MTGTGKRPQRDLTRAQAHTRFEEIEAAVFQSTTADELYGALDELLDPELRSRSDLSLMLETGGAAALIKLVLRGYELSSAQTRLISNRALLQLERIFRTIRPVPELVDQTWLVVAAQQAILLEHVESDLDALASAQSDDPELTHARRVLGHVHQLLRRKTKGTLVRYGVPLVAEPGISLAAA